MVLGDIKRVLVQECSVELSVPVTKIYNQITRSPRSLVNSMNLFLLTGYFPLSTLFWIQDNVEA